MSITGRFRPDHRVRVRRYNETSHNFQAATDISADVLAIQTTKAYGQVAGGFSLTTTLKLADFWETVNPDDLLTIELDPGDGTGLKPVLTGLINRIAETLSVDQAGLPSRSIRVSGFDLGKILHYHNCAWDVARYDKHFGDELMSRIDQGLRVSGTPSELIQSLVQTYLHAQVPWTESWLLLDRMDDSDDWMTLDYTLARHEGPLWQVMKQLSNEPWNVLHTETGADGKAHVVLERTPFHGVTGKLTRETFHSVSDSQAVAFDLGRDDTERTNWVWYDPHLMMFGQKDASVGYLGVQRDLLGYDEDSVFRHGMRGQHITTMFTPFGTKHLEPASPNDIARAGERGLALWNWYRRNHAYRNGSLTTKGNPAYRSGDGVVFDGNEYLIEQVSQNYVWGQMYQTTLGLTRGQVHE